MTSLIERESRAGGSSPPDGADAQKELWKLSSTYDNTPFEYASHNRSTRTRRLWQWHTSCVQGRIAGMVGEVESRHDDASSTALGQIGLRGTYVFMASGVMAGKLATSRSAAIVKR